MKTKKAKKTIMDSSVQTSETHNEDGLGAFLKKGRIQKGLSLADAAEFLELKSLQSIWDWENEKGSGIPADMLLRLVKLYELPPEEAYNHLIHFHYERTRAKIDQKFNESKIKIFGKK